MTTTPTLAFFSSNGILIAGNNGGNMPGCTELIDRLAAIIAKMEQFVQGRE